MIDDTSIREDSFERVLRQEVQRIFENATHFTNGFPKILTWAREQRGWAIMCDHGYWRTQSRKPKTVGINGPSFDSFGELLEWLFSEESLNDPE